MVTYFPLHRFKVMNKIDGFLDECRLTLQKLEDLELYERCHELLLLIKAIEAGDTETYIKMVFDVKGLTKEGFFEKGMTYAQMEKRITKFFGIESVFEYSLIGGGTLINFFDIEKV